MQRMRAFWNATEQLIVGLEVTCPGGSTILAGTRTPSVTAATLAPVNPASRIQARTGPSAASAQVPSSLPGLKQLVLLSASGARFAVFGDAQSSAAIAFSAAAARPGEALSGLIGEQIDPAAAPRVQPRITTLVSATFALGTVTSPRPVASPSPPPARPSPSREHEPFNINVLQVVLPRQSVLYVGAA
jgi:hypothetical protein